MDFPLPYDDEPIPSYVESNSKRGGKYSDDAAGSGSSVNVAEEYLRNICREIIKLHTLRSKRNKKNALGGRRGKGWVETEEGKVANDLET